MSESQSCCLPPAPIVPGDLPSSLVENQLLSHLFPGLVPGDKYTHWSSCGSG